MKRIKLFLQPALVFLSSPLLSFVSCGTKAIVLDYFYQIYYDYDASYNSLITKSVYTIEQNTQYNFKINMKQWQGSTTDVHHFTFIIGDKDEPNPCVSVLPQQCSFKTGDYNLKPTFSSWNDTENAWVDFNDKEDIEKILQTDYIQCSIKTATIIPNNNVTSDYYFIFFEGIGN